MSRSHLTPPSRSKTAASFPSPPSTAIKVSLCLSVSLSLSLSLSLALSLSRARSLSRSLSLARACARALSLSSEHRELLHLGVGPQLVCVWCVWCVCGVLWGGVIHTHHTHMPVTLTCTETFTPTYTYECKQRCAYACTLGFFLTNCLHF
jgi:hypothetical protein